MLLLRKDILCKSKRTSIHLIPLSLQMRQDKAMGWWVPTLKHSFLEKHTKPCRVECGLESSALLALRATQALTTCRWLVKLLPYIYSVSTWFGFLWFTSHIHCVSLFHALYLDISCSYILLKLNRVKLSLHFLLFLISSLRKSYEYDQLHPPSPTLYKYTSFLYSTNTVSF